MSAFSSKKGIPPEDFYGRTNPIQDKIEAILKKEQTTQKTKVPNFMTRLLGPSQTWKIFKKQNDAIGCCLNRRNGLMCFTFEDFNGRRMFLVAHPKVFWSFNVHRFFRNCSTYEIIQEYSGCKLYLDIEYEFQYNQSCNGERMLSNLLNIINYNLNAVFNIQASLEDILDLDSSSSVKFSRHIIYEIKNIAFQNNYAVGNFIKKICAELKEASENSRNLDASCSNEKLMEVSRKYNLTENDILELFVKDNKNKTKLFIDEGVYTKNRHFRILGSSKQSKNIPLVISKTNKYKPEQINDLYDCCLFLDSLVTYFSWEVLKVLECEELGTKKIKNAPNHRHSNVTVTDCAVYPQIDSYIQNIISPNGRIRRKVYFSDSSTIVYDIQGFRYCENIKREHKSNNIKYIVDLQVLGYYQKCYDPDCENFRSCFKPLPDEIKFFFENDDILIDDSLVYNFTEFSDEDFIKAVQQIENEFEETISDEDLGKVVDYTEAMLDVNW